MNHRTGIITLVTIASLGLSSAALGCGESMHRAGKGLSYRTYTAPLPANLLIFAGSEKQKEIAAALAKSGHGVRMVETEAEFSAELNKGGYDVVIAPFSARNTAGSSAASYLPVVAGGQEQAEAKSLYKRSIRTDGDIKQYLKAIHRTLKSKA